MKKLLDDEKAKEEKTKKEQLEKEEKDKKDKEEKEQQAKEKKAEQKEKKKQEDKQAKMEIIKEMAKEQATIPIKPAEAFALEQSIRDLEAQLAKIKPQSLSILKATEAEKAAE